MIKRILVPTDFSTVAANALRYTLAFARYVEATQIDILHVFTPQTAADGAVIPPVAEMMNTRREQLDRFLAEFTPAENLEINRALEVGLAADIICEKSADYDMVIMGAYGEADILENIFGSISTAVAQHALCPVMLIPDQAEFGEFRHILYASDSLSLSRRAVLQLIDFNELFRARIHFVHINEGEEEERGNREHLFASLFSTPEPEFAFDIEEVEADSVAEGLHQYMRDKPIDLSVMVTRNRGFWANFFHTSQTKKMALEPTVPLMVFHLEN
jgi:nucleotide-binding universal stress UspA family protein